MPVDLTFRDDCAMLTLNRPEALNALSFAILGEIGEAFDQVSNSRTKALITGAGQKAGHQIASTRFLDVGVGDA